MHGFLENYPCNFMVKPSLTIRIDVMSHYTKRDLKGVGHLVGQSQRCDEQSVGK